jgi:hypothetical protein
MPLKLFSYEGIDNQHSTICRTEINQAWRFPASGQDAVHPGSSRCFQNAVERRTAKAKLFCDIRNFDTLLLERAGLLDLLIWHRRAAFIFAASLALWMPSRWRDSIVSRPN